MTKNLRVGMLFIACGLAACTTEEAKSTADGGVDSSGTGGGGGGAGGAGGSSANLGVLCPAPVETITDFTFDADGGSTTEAKFGNANTFSGSAGFVYPTPAITSDVTGGNWHISGNVANYAGFGLNIFDCNHLDASAFKGITFKISGTSPKKITMGIATISNNISPEWLVAHPVAGVDYSNAVPGLCTPAAGAVNQYSQSTCGDASYQLTTTDGTISVNWADFKNGKPKAFNPSEITNIYWRFEWTEGATPYDVDITIDDLAFIP